ncbi:MAG: NAD+ synthase [bacterium]|jgi:NAD+ synthase (glutamine-hydrolysing)|nr:NAD+ synthase [candidate division KSB1 bacterium]MDH7559618.1 NAD+ synthase [bacterium]
MLRIALFQINPTVGDLKGNAQLVISGVQKARGVGADVAVFPELVLTGYPPEDLLLRRRFAEDNRLALESVVAAAKGLVAVVGFADHDAAGLHNAAAVMRDGQLVATYHKICLPNYGVFDEKRYFVPGGEVLVLDVAGVRIGVSICEDLWVPEGVVETLAYAAGAQVVVNISCSPFHALKGQERAQMMTARAKRCRVFLAYCNLVGGQEELVFDGQSLVIAPSGEVLAHGRAFAEEMILVDIDPQQVHALRAADNEFIARQKGFAAPYPQREVVLSGAEHHFPKQPLAPGAFENLDMEEEVWRALVLGTRDYVCKNGFRDVVLGLSGGIDSALVAAIAAEAVGPQHLTGVRMPSVYTSEQSMTDAQQVAMNLGINLITVPIQQAVTVYRQLLAEHFRGLPEDVTEENIQARIRGNILMAFANKFNWLVLATGNKSEVAVGYCTIYGDMVGGFAVLKDVPKTLVYRLAHHVNARSGREVIPRSVIERAPTAELRPNQKDEDSLPPYRVLDPILEAYVERDLSIADIVGQGFDEATVRRVVRMVDMSEYKRRQAAPGIKITPRAFGKDRRMPITNRYREE